MSSPNNNKKVPNWTYRLNTRTVKDKKGKKKVVTIKQLLFKGRVATRNGVRRGKRGGTRTVKNNVTGEEKVVKIKTRATMPGNASSKAGRVSYKALRNKAINLGLKVHDRKTWARKYKKALLAKPPVELRRSRRALIEAILSKNLPKYVPKERPRMSNEERAAKKKERSNRAKANRAKKRANKGLVGKARKTNAEKAATRRAALNRAKAKRAILSRAKKTLAARRNLAARLKAAAEKAKAANAAAAAANAEVAKLQAQVAQSAKRKAVEEVNANKNRAVKRVKRVRSQLKKLGLSPNNINKRLRNQGLL